MLLDQTINIAEFDALLERAFRFRGGRNRSILVSYDFPVDIPDLTTIVHRLGRWRNTLFCWKAGDASFEVVAAGSVLKLTAEGPDRFDSVREAAGEWSSAFVTNLTPVAQRRQPIFVGAASFYPKLEADLWNDFSPAGWEVPELLIYEIDGSKRAALQFLVKPGDDREPIIDAFEERVALLDNELGAHWRADPSELFIYDLYDAPADGRDEWRRSVKSALKAIRTGSYEKIVLSRMIEKNIRADVDAAEWLSRLSDRYPGCHLYVLRSGRSTFFGASPERLVKLENGKAHCNAMAGSTTRGSSKSEDDALGQALLNSSKNRREYAYVVAHIREVMSRYCSEVYTDEAPSLRKLPYIQHLYSRISGRPVPSVSPVVLAGALHPTPAVGGFPVIGALDAMKKLETYDRGLYAGFVGWFNFAGDGDFCVSIRSALANSGGLHSFAGAGIVEGSSPDAEFEETEIKLRAIASLLSF